MRRLVKRCFSTHSLSIRSMIIDPTAETRTQRRMTGGFRYTGITLIRKNPRNMTKIPIDIGKVEGWKDRDGVLNTKTEKSILLFGCEVPRFVLLVLNISPVAKFVHNCCITTETRPPQ